MHHVLRAFIVLFILSGFFALGYGVAICFSFGLESDVPGSFYNRFKNSYMLGVWAIWILGIIAAIVAFRQKHPGPLIWIPVGISTAVWLIVGYFYVQSLL